MASQLPDNRAQMMSSEKCLKYALDLGFTSEDYQKATSMSQEPQNFDQLLKTLTKVSQNSSPHAGFEHVSSDIDTSITSISNISNTSQNRTSMCVFELSDEPIALRPIYVDGSNVAMEHGNNKNFSWLGIRLCVEWFLQRGHKVKVFVPSHKCKCNSSDDEEILNFLIDNNLLCKTPAGCNDDYYIIDAAHRHNGIIVSNDMFRKEQLEEEAIRAFLDKNRNRLPYTFLDNEFLPPRDPCGQYGPRLDEFLRVQTKRNLPKPISHSMSLTMQPQYSSGSNLNAYDRNNHLSRINTHMPIAATHSLPITRFNDNATTISSLHRHVENSQIVTAVTSNNATTNDVSQTKSRNGKQMLCRLNSYNLKVTDRGSEQLWKQPLHRNPSIPTSIEEDKHPYSMHSKLSRTSSYGQLKQPRQISR